MNRRVVLFLLFAFVLSVVLVGQVNAVIPEEEEGDSPKDIFFLSSSLDLGTVTAGQTKTRDIVLVYNGSAIGGTLSLSFTGPFRCVSGCSLSFRRSQSIGIVFSPLPGSEGSMSGEITARLGNLKTSADLFGTASPQGAQPIPGDTADTSQGSSSLGGIIQIKNPLKTDSLADLIDTLINFIFTISIAVAPVVFLYGGFLFVTAAGRPEQITKARSILIWTAIGFVVILLSRGLITILKNLLEI